MKDNIIGILNQLSSSLDRYENNISRESMTPHERVLDTIEHDYCRFFNHDQWLAALRDFMTEEEAEIWNHFPEFTMTEEGKSIADIVPELGAGLAASAQQLTDSLVSKGWIYAYPDNKYVQTYLLDVLFAAVTGYDGSMLHKACVDLWMKLVDDGNESRKLRTATSEHRVLAHEGTLTGDSRHGRIPMNLDIPDTRQVLDIDKLSEILKNVRRIALIDCICRSAKDITNSRECDNPIDVCILFDESADGAIDAGMGRELSYDETLDIVRDCRERGLVQVISNAVHPLALCNCCDCCCLCLRTMARNEYAMTDVSRFIVDVVKADQCVKCGACMKVCPNKAIQVHDNYIQTGVNQCFGCGLCVSKCPKGVLKMSLKPGAPYKIDREYLKRIYI